MRLKIVLAAAGLALVAPALAQNTAEPPVVAPPPPTKTDPPPATSTPPVTTPPADTTPAPPPVVVVPPPQTAPPLEPVTIDPDAAYPNGFGDPADPFANDMSLAYRQERGFDWGLLGLLGLFGLIPLFRDRGGRRVVYVERDDLPQRRVVERDDLPPRRVVRTDRIDEE